MNGKMSQEPPSATSFPSLFCILTVSPLTAPGTQVLMERELWGAVEGPCGSCPSLLPRG